MSRQLRQLVALSLAPFFYAAQVEIVLARCQEDISWIKEFGFDKLTTSYDKCGNVAGPGAHVAIRNVGREGGTYLQHIVGHYDDLAEWTVFSQAERPTYGYRGHRLGGGHLMNNVRFQDYVDAAKNKVQRPLFFVFTNALVMTGDGLQQCIRTGYGGAFAETGDTSPSIQSCGEASEWQKWFAFPTWFRDMINDLLHEQHAPISTLSAQGVFQAFQVDVSFGVTFFAQGARFAASREAIQSRPKQYYEALLALMNHPDPWAGYVLEWLWWYVLGGSSSPCGFEAEVLQGYQKWAQSPGRFAITQAVSGNSTSGTSVTVSGNTTISTDIVGAPSQNVLFQPGSVSTISAPLSVSNGGATSGTCEANDCTLNVNSDLTMAMPLQANNVIFNFGSGANLKFTSGSGRAKGCKFTCPSAGTMFIESVNQAMDFVSSTISCPQRVGTQAARRRTNYATAMYCGTTLTDLIVLSGGAAEFQVNCTVTGQSYSNVVSTLTYQSGSLLVLSGVAQGVLPTLISSWNSPSGMPVAVTTAQSSAFSQTVVVYGKNGTCATSWSDVTFDNCPSGLTCSVSGSDYSSSACQMVYSQTATSTSTSSNNNGLLGLIALVALVPLALLCGLGLWYFLRSAPAPEPVATPEFYYPRVEEFPGQDGLYPSITSSPEAYTAYVQPGASAAYPTYAPTPAGGAYYYASGF